MLTHTLLSVKFQKLHDHDISRIDFLSKLANQNGYTRIWLLAPTKAYLQIFRLKFSPANKAFVHIDERVRRYGVSVKLTAKPIYGLMMAPSLYL